MKQRYILKNNTLKTRFLTLTLLALLIGGGMQAIGQNAYTLNHTSATNKTYYVTSTNEVAISANNTTASGPLAYKFYVSESPNPTSGTKYDHFYNVRVNNANATVTFIFQTDKPVGFSNGSDSNQNAFRVTKGTLKLKLDEDKYKSDITLRRVGTFTTSQNTSCPFHLINVEGEASDQKLIIEGLDPKLEDLLYEVSNVKQDTATYLAGRQFVIDGAANITSVNMTTGNPTYTGISNKKPLFRIETGTLHLTNVTIQNSINDANDATHGGIYLMLNDNASQPDRNLDVILTHCWLHNIVSTNFKTGYPGIGLQWQMRKANGSGSLVLKRSKFSSLSNNNGEDAAIRSTTGCKASVTIDSCNINNNFGGGIRWQGLVADPMQVKNTTIKGNYTKKSGGGIISKAPIVLTACKILNNTAYENGGGINYMCFDEPGMSVAEAGMIYPNNLELTMDAATIIDGNKTETGNGGGIMVWGRLINLTRTGQMGYVYHEYDQYGNVVGPYQMKVNLNGATIQDNTAHNNGGGIYIVREEDASCYLLDCKLSYGNIKGNKALNGNGGGVCINQTGTPNLAHLDSLHPAQNIILTTGGLAYDMTINKNDAYLDGGGIYLYSINDGPGWNEYQKFQTIVTLRDRTKIKENTAYTTETATEPNNHGGGGLFVQQGDVTIAGTAAAGETNNPLFEENKTQYSGGGICLIKGNIFADYCRVSSNLTTSSGNSRGGGVYLKEGNITLNYSKVFTNRANTFGGGIYCLGTISASKVEINDSEMKSNRAGNQGGGIYLHEGIINITRSTIGGTSYADANVAGTNGNNDYKGGGIYTQTGNVNIVDSKISYNLANRRGGGIYTKSGPVTIKGSEISYNQAGWRKSATGSSVIDGHSQATGGGIHTDGGLVTINPDEDEPTQTEIKNNIAKLNGGGIFTGTETSGGVTTKGKVAVYGNHESQGGHLINITNNEAVNGSGGGIFCLGDADGDRYVLLRRVNLSNNKAGDGSEFDNQPSELSGVTSRCGGGLYLYQGLIDMNLCTMDNNTAKLNGGGANNHAGNINVQSCFIRNNEAGKNNTDAGSGGGIYTNSGTIGVNIWGTPATVQSEARRTEITGNKAKLNGGGLNTHNGKILVQGNSDDANERILINNNEATSGSGGAIFCMGEPATGGINTNFITLQYVDLKGNKALSGTDSYDVTVSGTMQTISKGCGGGVYLQLGEIKATDVVMQNNFANRNGGAINNHDGFVDIYGCIIGGDDYYDGSLTDGSGHGNKAGNSGGGIYTNQGNIDVEDYIEHSQGASKRFTSKLNYNWAEENGGALNTHSGTVWVNKNERDDETPITYNKANKGGGIYANSGTIFLHNAHVDNNIAFENGGGANNHAGDINIYGGSLNNNTAQEGRGGGVFTYVGDINILPFPSTLTHPTRNDGTQVFNNLAKLNGGGINNHTGRVDARYASMRNNTSSLGNGGGIFCEGPHGSATGFTIRLLNSELKENKTRGEDGTATDPTGRGGGIYLKYGSIYAHNSQIIKNKANINGGGLDNHDGSILVYGCEISDNRAENGRGGGIYTQTGSITTGPSLVGSNSNATVISGNYAKVNGGGINNHNGDIYLNGDHIIDNIAETGHGGGIYIANGTIDMFGGKIANNEAKLGDGGGVWSGGGTFNIQKRQGKPVVTVMDVEIHSSTEATVHYHLIDKGTSDIASHGITIDDDDPITFNPSTSGHETGDDGCYRIKVTGLDANTTYTVKSFATNAAPLTGESDTLQFTTFSDKPSVISGTVANITKNSAEGSGKLLYSNGATKCGVVYIKKDGNLGSLSDLELGKEDVLEVNEEGTFEDDYFFTLNLPSLESGKKYFARAYATNDNGTAYGDTVSFVTLKDTPDMGSNLVVVDPEQITANDAHFSFTMPNSTDWSTITLYGFVISEDDDPEIHADGDHTIVFTTAPSSGYTFAKKASEDTPNPIVLNPGTTYYVRAFASNIANPGTDISNYSVTATTQFFTKDDAGKPIVRNINISTITQNCADITGAIKDAGTSAITNYGIVWSQTNEQPEVGAEGCYNYDLTSGIPAVNANFTVHMPGTQDTLKLNTTYHVRTYAKNTAGYGYSNKFNFSTLPMNIPEVIINQVVDITKISAKALCSVNDGGGEVTDWGLKWSDTENIAGATDINKPGGTATLENNAFEVQLSGLSANTNYYLWVYATNSVGTHTTSHYVRFKTAYDVPEVETKPISAIAYNANAASGHQNTATFNAKVTPQGNNVKTYGVCWSTSDTPSRMTSDYTDSGFEETTGDLSAALEYNYANKVQKYSNTKYYVRAYASVNEPDADNKLAEIVYSPEKKEFVTLPSMKTDAASNITHNGATLGGTIVSRDINGYLRGGKYGICWGTANNPTKGTDNFVEGEITEANGNTFPYTLNATGLTPNTTYYYRAYYYKGEGNIAYAKTATNTFKTKSYVLNVVSANEAQGTVNPTIVGMNQGEYVSVYANPVAGYELKSWTANSGTISDSCQNPVTFTMGTENATLTATFKVAEYTITVQASPSEGGLVSGGGTTFHYGDETNLTATANPGYNFLNWTLNGEEVSSQPSITVIVTGNATYLANFEANTGGSKGNTSMNATPNPRPRDIYPAPAREPWDWDDDDFIVVSDTLTEGDASNAEDEELRAVRERISRTVTEPVDVPQIIENKATEGKGGGIYMENNDPANPTKLVFAGGDTDETKGKILYNFAGQAGGGIYIARKAYMQMKGHCEVNANWVPKGKDGGGVYLAGRLYVGENWDDALTAHALKVSRNFAIDGSMDDVVALYGKANLTPTEKKMRNNILLARNHYVWGPDNVPGQIAVEDTANVITILSNISGKHISDPTQNVTAETNMGFSVKEGFCPVVATAGEFPNETANSGHYLNDGETANGKLFNDEYEKWLANLMPSFGEMSLTDNSAIFEDSETYIAIHSFIDNQPFRAKFIYLWGSWTNPAVQSDPEYLSPMYGGNGPGDENWLGHYIIKNSENTQQQGTNDTLTIPSTDTKADTLVWEIYSEEGLAWFSNYVNGLNSFSTGDVFPGTSDTIHRKYNKNVNPYAKAKLMNDLDMRAHFWVPIGSVTKYNEGGVSSGGDIYTDEAANPHPFKGEFDGQGHVIKGIDCRFLTGIEKFGLFGDLSDGAVVKNVFVDDALYATDKINNDFEYMLGGISGVMSENATLSGAEARATLDLTVCKPDNTYAGGLVGKTRGTNENRALIHSSMAMPEIKGEADYVGGLVGYLHTSDSLINSFSNPKFLNEPAATKYFGGLVGVNKGLVENCYARLQDGSSETSLGFLAGTNNGDIKYSYIPNGKPYLGNGSENGLTGHTNYGLTQRNSDDGKYNYAHKDQQMEATTNGYAENGIFKGLLPTLNNWVRKQDFDSTNWENTKGYAQWSRTLASDINGDYPVLMLGDFRSLGSADNIFIHYDDSLSHLVEKFNGDDYTADHPQIFVYDADSSWVNNNSNVSIFIDENVGLTQNTGNVLNNVRVGVTLDNSKKGSGDWHFFASPLKDVPLGLEYHTKDAEEWYKEMINHTGTSYILPGYGTTSGGTSEDVESDNNVYPGHQSNAITHATWSDRNYTDPPKTTWSTTKPGFFPTNTPYGTWRPQNGGHTADAVGGYFDFYCYDEATYHWINFKREGSANYMDHWYENENSHGNHNKLQYFNETTFLEGKGYLVAVRDTTMLMADGTLNNDRKKASVSYSNDDYITPFWPSYAQMLRAVNLVGNPYQSYLDFTKFAETNSAYLIGGNQASYAVMDQDSTSYIYYTAKASINGIDASPYIHPMQSFFVRVDYSEDDNVPVTGKSLTFENDMRIAAKWRPGLEATEGISPYRGLRPNYPLVNLICTDSDGKRDYTTVETGRPDVGGGHKMRGLHAGNAVIYAHYNNNSYQTAFTPAGVSEVPVRFDAIEPDNFTIRWNTMHGDFSYLHLIDNLTGMDIDCLRNSEYRFQGNPTDYKSRFKLVFHCTGIDEEPDEPTNENGTTNFAFQMDDELVVNGEGTLQLFDINGRCLLSTQAVGEQSTISLPRVAAGIYVLRLTNHNQTKVQKMVIK